MIVHDIKIGKKTKRVKMASVLKYDLDYAPSIIKSKNLRIDMRIIATMSQILTGLAHY